MDKAQTWRDIIALWPAREAFAQDVGVKVSRVHKWAQTGAVRAEFYQRILDKAAERGIPLSAGDLVRAATPQEDAA